jgi:hypothetical protein
MRYAKLDSKIASFAGGAARSLALVLLLCTSPVHAAAPIAPNTEPLCSSTAVAPQVAMAAMSDWWHEIYGPIEKALGSRQGMLQFGAVGMVLALFIIWYRKP